MAVCDRTTHQAVNSGLQEPGSSSTCRRAFFRPNYAFGCLSMPEWNWCRLSSVRLISHAGPMESIMRAIWKQAWKATVVPAVFLSSAALGQTRGAWVDPPADLSALLAQQTELSPSVKLPSQATTSSAPATVGPASETRPRFSRSAGHSKSKAQTESSSFEHSGQQGQSASAPTGAPRNTSDMATRPNLIQGRSSSREQAARSLAIHYLNLWSTSNRQALQTTPEFYGSRVLFHGKRMSFGELLAEKRRFAQRWPDRDYRYQPDTLNVRCSPGTNTCTVRSAFDFEAVNPKQNERSRGVGAHELVVSFAGERPVIIFETSRVLRRKNRL
jgi:hypothetical protein